MPDQHEQLKNAHIEACRLAKTLAELGDMSVEEQLVRDIAKAIRFKMIAATTEKR